ncbi:CotH kinase family protein [Rufibacter immobilis]|uniref:CotH kinase family protein n=1 Tax=Rufibacter immobilis TaxID=1348778 RepID=UPI001615ACCE|nr:CotH kinase family protein [Rufibacter immobilis]
MTTVVLALVGMGYKPEKVTIVRTSTKVPVPVFSQSSGFYGNGLRLSLSTTHRGAKIYYTTDGSRPTFDSEIYTGPVLIQEKIDEPNKLSEIKTAPVFNYPLYNVYKGTIVRAITALNDSVISEEARASFFVHPKGRERYSLPVISLVTDADSLFGYKAGIYVGGATADDKDFYIRNSIKIDDTRRGFPANYKRRGQQWYRPVTLDFFEEGSNKGFHVKAKVGIHGNASREQQHKSLKVILENNGQIKELIYPVFSPTKPDTLSSFVLRSSSQDRHSTMFRDALLQSFVKGYTQLDIQEYRPTIMFINGEYWGINNIRHRYDEYYFQHKYRIPQDSLAIVGVKSNLGGTELTVDQRVGRVILGVEGDQKPYHALLAYIRSHDLSNLAFYQYVTKQIDIDNFIDYLLAELYYANQDWPNSNLQMWRYKVPMGASEKVYYKDGRWRWMLMDIDNGFLKGKHSYNMVSRVLKSEQLGPLFSALLKNPAFRNKFFERAEYHLSHTFEVNRVIAEINAKQQRIMPEIKEHLERWRTPASVKVWEKEVESLREFARKRPEYLKKELEKLRQQFIS